MIEMQSREVPSLRTGTFSTAEGMEAEENLPLQIAGSGAELLDESTPVADERAGVEENSEFYREAGVLAPTHEQIAQRAYELYVARDRTEGYAREDWLEAEKQLSEEKRE